jgi:hypothetical protein
MSGATAQEFTQWAAKAKTCTIDELKFIIKDCREAQIAFHGWNPEKENYYSDQRMTFADELRRRQA